MATSLSSSARYLAHSARNSAHSASRASVQARSSRAALAWSTETARLARQHNNANVVAVGARMHSTEDAVALVETFLATPFSGEERHARRVSLLTAYEQSRGTDVADRREDF